ncbi:hypothetical protein ACFQZ4_54235 [Catellatospora coxensis]
MILVEVIILSTKDHFHSLSGRRLDHRRSRCSSASARSSTSAGVFARI